MSGPRAFLSDRTLRHAAWATAGERIAGRFAVLSKGAYVPAPPSASDWYVLAEAGLADMALAEARAILDEAEPTVSGAAWLSSRVLFADERVALADGLRAFVAEGGEP